MARLPKLIGMTGKARSGKDTAAAIMADLYGYKTYAMAKPIKDACRVMFGWDDRHLYGDLKEVVDPEFGVTPREAMQKLGTEFGRGMINPKIWEIRAKQDIVNNEYLIVTDVRFDNEAELVKRHGGIVIGISRFNRDEIQGATAHSSEDGISGHLVDYHIGNNGTLLDLHDAIKATLKLATSESA